MLPALLFVERDKNTHGCVVITDSGLESFVFAFVLTFGTGDLYQYRFSIHIVGVVAEHAETVYAVIPCFLLVGSEAVYQGDCPVLKLERIIGGKFVGCGNVYRHTVKSHRLYAVGFETMVIDEV